MSFKIHGIVRDKLIEIYALLELDSVIVVANGNREEMEKFFDKIPKIIEML